MLKLRFDYLFYTFGWACDGTTGPWGRSAYIVKKPCSPNYVMQLDGMQISCELCLHSSQYSCTGIYISLARHMAASAKSLWPNRRACNHNPLRQCSNAALKRQPLTTANWRYLHAVSWILFFKVIHQIFRWPYGMHENACILTALTCSTVNFTLSVHANWSANVQLKVHSQNCSFEFVQLSQFIVLLIVSQHGGHCKGTSESALPAWIFSTSSI